MQACTQLTGLVVPIDRPNVDTDAIIPKQFLKSIKRSGFGPNAFDEWRYLDVGQPGADNSKRPLNPDFVLNQARYQGAQILLTRDNFGCGSSREHAPWALRAWGIRAVVSSSFADIFKNNALKNGLLPVQVTPVALTRIVASVEADPKALFEVDLAQQVLVMPNGMTVRFPIDAFSKKCLLEGLDELGYLLSHEAAVGAYEARRDAEEVRG